MNLRRVRKRLVREAAERTAEENRVKHGRSRTERDAAAALQEKSERELDAKRLDDQ